jgi:hypothetical protein
VTARCYEIVVDGTSVRVQGDGASDAELNEALGEMVRAAKKWIGRRTPGHCTMDGGLGAVVRQAPSGHDVRVCENGHEWVDA